VLDEVREFVRFRTQFLILGFDGRSFEGFRREFGECVSTFLDPAVATDHGRNADNLSRLFRMADRTLHRDSAAEAVTDDIRPWDLEIIEQLGHIVGKVFERQIAFDVGRTPVTLHFDGDHFPRFGKFAGPIIPVA
jgi:hypothetical protein